MILLFVKRTWYLDPYIEIIEFAFGDVPFGDVRTERKQAKIRQVSVNCVPR